MGIVQFFYTYFGEAMFGIVLVVLGATGGLFAADATMNIILVFVASEAQ